MAATIWCLQPSTAGKEAIARKLAHYALLDTYGPCSDGLLTRTEVSTSSHAQLWLMAFAGDLLAARLLKSVALESEAAHAWNNETNLAARCIYTDADGPHVILPGTRDGGPAQPVYENPNRNKVIPALLDGWRNPPRTPKVGSYDASIPLLKRAFAAGASPAALVGGVARLPSRFDYHVRQRPDGSFYSWFAAGLEGASEPLWGAGWSGTKVLLDWTAADAVARGEAF
jgi:hypothetical protein